jgi:hypothetical protein
VGVLFTTILIAMTMIKNNPDRATDISASKAIENFLEDAESNESCCDDSLRTLSETICFYLFPNRTSVCRKIWGQKQLTFAGGWRLLFATCKKSKQVI